ncbi:MAG TPA: uroporphyrinogen decarboxylase [Dehalococcoidia bacterium]|nr:uroporphyrinogen decarboxylase [Dehalococcoidia bacterium]
MEKKWEEMTPDERQEALFARWISPEGATFASPEAEKAYKERATRIKDAIQMKKLPDRVPIFVLPSFYPIYYSGMTPRDSMYDYDKSNAAFKKFVIDFGPDGNLGAAVPGPGKFFDIMDYKLYSWPGHGVSPNHSYQANEGEYMMVEEYNDLIEDPSNYFYKTYLPRVFGALEFWQQLPSVTGIVEMYGVAGNFIPFGLPPMQEALKKLMEAGEEALKWGQAMGAFGGDILASGYPVIVAGFTKAPFDFLGDTLRGTRGLMVDMYRNPDKVLKAMDVLTPLMIKMGVNTALGAGNPFIFIPLHKGADGFLNDEQYKKFYWPTLRKVMIGLIEQGVVPFPAAEGGYNSRLEVVKDLPKGKTMWLCDKLDMKKAKKTLGQVACLAGNMPSALLNLGTKQQITDYAKKLLDDCAKGGGYIMSNGSFFDEAQAENIHAMVEFTREYGVYK